MKNAWRALEREADAHGLVPARVWADVIRAGKLRREAASWRARERARRRAHRRALVASALGITRLRAWWNRATRNSVAG